MDKNGMIAVSSGASLQPSSPCSPLLIIPNTSCFQVLLLVPIICCLGVPATSFVMYIRGSGDEKTIYSEFPFSAARI